MHPKFCVDAVIKFPGSRLYVLEAGELRHSDGLGPVDYRVYDMNGRYPPGTIINTPFGQCEVVEKPVEGRTYATQYFTAEDDEFLSLPRCA